jgi:hypothetical protein
MLEIESKIKFCAKITSAIIKLANFSPYIKLINASYIIKKSPLRE